MAMLMLALGCGLVASIGITQVLAKRHDSPAVITGETVPIFVAIKDIPFGVPLTAEVLKLEPWPKDKIPTGAVSNIADAEGRRTRQKLYSGEPILENKLLGKGANSQGASAVIPKGYRVVAVQVDSVSGSGLILPGDRVDVLVYLVGNSQHEIPETSTRTVLQDVKVFAVNEVVELDKDKEGKERPSSKTISLLVTPAQAAKVTLASEMGKIRLVMRSPEDNTHAEDAVAKPEELLGRSAYADRDKESPLDKKNEATKGLLDYINQMKAGMAASQTMPAHEQPQPPSTWTMRILQPDKINDVVLEADNTPAAGNPLTDHWRISGGSMSGSGNSKSAPDQMVPAKKEAKPATPPITPPTTPPITMDPWEADQNQIKTSEQTLTPNSEPVPADQQSESVPGE